MLFHRKHQLQKPFYDLSDATIHFIVIFLIMFVLSLTPAGSELLKKLDSRQSRVVQPPAGLPVVTVGSTGQLPASPHLPARAE